MVMDRRWGLHPCVYLVRKKRRIKGNPRRRSGEEEERNKKVNYVFVTMVCVWLEATGGHCLVGKERRNRNCDSRSGQPQLTHKDDDGPQRAGLLRDDGWWNPSTFFLPSSSYISSVCSTHNDILYMQPVLLSKTRRRKKKGGTWWWCWHRHSFIYILFSFTLLLLGLAVC